MDLDWVDVFPIEHRDISAIAMLEGWPPSPGMLHNPPFWIAGGCCWFLGEFLGSPENESGIETTKGDRVSKPPCFFHSLTYGCEQPLAWTQKKTSTFRQWCWPRIPFPSFPSFLSSSSRNINSGKFPTIETMGAICSLEPKVIHVTVPLVETSRWKVAVKVGDFWSTGFEVLLFALSRVKVWVWKVVATWNWPRKKRNDVQDLLHVGVLCWTSLLYPF